MTSLPPSSLQPLQSILSLQLIASFSLLITVSYICCSRVTIADCHEVGIVRVNEGDRAVGGF